MRNQYLPSEAEACKCKARFSKSEVRTGIHGSGKKRFESRSSNGSTLRGQRMIPTLGLQLSTNQKQAVFCPTGLEWDPHLSAREKRTHLLCLIPLPTKKKQNKKPFEVILPSTSSPFLLFRTACSLSVPWNRPHQSMWTHKKKKKCSKCITPFKKFPYFQTVARKYE